MWGAISEAGGIDAYIEKQLIANNYLVERKDTDNMSKAELERYKKTLKKEAEEKRKLKKETWQAYKATHIVHLGESVFWNDQAEMGKWDLENAEERAAENELPMLDKPDHLAKALDISIKDLRWLAYHREAATGIHYRRFTIPKRTGGERSIWAPLPKLKESQRWVLRNILEHLPVHGDAHGFLSGRSIFTNAAVHTNSKIVLRVDLKDFFPTVTFPRVKGIFRKAGYREQISTLLALICTESPRDIVKYQDKTYYVALGPRCLPQGAPTSPALSNTVCMHLDRRLAGLAKKLGWRYTRYADDLTFSLPETHKDQPKLGLLLGSIGRIVKDEGFEVHGKKTWVARKGSKQSVTGLIVNEDLKPRVPRKLRRQIRAAIHNMKNGKALPEGESIHRLIGYASFIYMVQPELGSKYLNELRPFAK